MGLRAFIGSASESLAVANAIQENLERDMDVTVWNQGLFDLSATAVDSLTKVLPDQDFGIFVLEPNDLLQLRGEEFQSTRDNVIFETGLFIGALGKERTFLVVPRNSPKLHLPTDLLGMTPADYDPVRFADNALAALGPACNKIRRAMKSLGASDHRMAPAIKKAYSQLVDTHGITCVYSQRGGEDAVHVYRASVKQATTRIWAIGMTNCHFLLQHTADLLQHLAKANIDVQMWVTTTIEPVWRGIATSFEPDRHEL